MNNNDKRKKLTRWATFLGVSGFILALLAAGTDDARDAATPQRQEQMASSKTTHAMAVGGILSMLGATILINIRDRKTK